MGYNVYTNPHKVRNRFEDNVSKKYFDINPANDIDAKIDNISKNIFDGLSKNSKKTPFDNSRL